MISPSEFMLYATPVILLISQEVRAYLTKRALQRMTDDQTATINTAGQERAQELQTTTLDAAAKLETTTLDTASKLALHTSDKANTLGNELIEIHEIVNGNTTALKARIAELEAQLQKAGQQP